MQSWDEIYKNNAPRMLGVCRRYVKDIQLAEDLMHEAFIAAMNKSETYSGKGSFEGWLRKVVINTALQHLRKNNNIVFADNELLDYYSQGVQQNPDSDFHPDSQRNVIENRRFTEQELLEIIDELPEHHKAVFNLYVIDEYKHNEIGIMLNISPGTSKSHLARARKKIQQMLFEKAQKKDEDKKKKWAFLFLFSSKQDPIDNLFKNTFKSFEIQPQNSLPFKDGTKLINTHQKFSVLKAVAGSKLTLVSLTGIIAAPIVYFLFIKDTPVKMREIIEPNLNKVEPLPVVEPSTENNIPFTNLKDTMQTEKEIVPPPDTIKKINKITNRDKKPDKSVEKKQIIIHKNVIKHDTIIKKVPVPNEK